MCSVVLDLRGALGIFPHIHQDGVDPLTRKGTEQTAAGMVLGVPIPARSPKTPQNHSLHQLNSSCIYNIYSIYRVLPTGKQPQLLEVHPLIPRECSPWTVCASRGTSELPQLTGKDGGAGH